MQQHPNPAPALAPEAAEPQPTCQPATPFGLMVASLAGEPVPRLPDLPGRVHQLQGDPEDIAPEVVPARAGGDDRARRAAQHRARAEQLRERLRQFRRGELGFEGR